jgi:hypothetical protein
MNSYINKNDLNKYVNMVDDYLQNPVNNYTIIVSALLMGSFGIKTLTKENIAYNYSVISPYDYKENKYNFGTTCSAIENLWHEICHLTINDLTKKYIIRVNADNIIQDKFTKMFYTDTETIINEYIIRAITIRLFEIQCDKKTAQQVLQYHIEKGFTELELTKNYIAAHCENNNKLLKDDRYKELMNYVVGKIV